MNKNKLNMIQMQIGYCFKNADLLQQAFVRRSYSKENGGENNEILEFIGDKALDLIVVKLLSEKYGYYSCECENFDENEDCCEFISEYSEGKLTEIKKKLVCRTMLSKRIRLLGLQYELIMGKSDCDQDVHEIESVQEDLFEAIIGAVALDSNWNLEKIKAVVDLMLDPEYYLENGFDDEENYVELVQQWYQKQHGCIPVYCFRQPLSIMNAGGWECSLALSPLEKGFLAYGNTKSEARMNVAKKAYNFLLENNLLCDWVDEIGEPEIDRAINQLQELYQKGYIGAPWYDFYENYDIDGCAVWRCECGVQGEEYITWGEFSSKKQGKKYVAYEMLCHILGWEDEDEA